MNHGCFLSRRTAIMNGSAVDNARSGKTTRRPKLGRLASVDCESMIERACWINYKPVASDYRPIGRGFIRPAANADEWKLHVSHVHHAHVPGPSHPGRLHPLDRHPPLDGGQVVFDSNTFRGSLHAGRAPNVLSARDSLLKLWHTGDISEFVNRTRGSCHTIKMLFAVRH